MDNTSDIRVTYSHPDMPRCGTMKGTLTYDSFDGVTVFIPDEEHNEVVLSYGYEPEGGLFLEGATVKPVA